MRGRDVERDSRPALADWLRSDGIRSVALEFRRKAVEEPEHEHEHEREPEREQKEEREGEQTSNEEKEKAKEAAKEKA